MRIVRGFIVLLLSAAAGCAQHAATSSLPVAPGASLSHELPIADTFKLLYSFKGNPDGQNPYAGLVNLNGTLYGTTYNGGKYELGVLFKVSTSGVERVLHTFGNPTSPDGSTPYGTPIALNGTLYGTTYYGGHAPANHGTVYKATTAGAERVVCSFTSSQGEFPYAGVVAVNGTLYGADYQGGKKNYGTVYGCSMSGKVRVLHSFTRSPDGAYPYSPPAALAGTLYGTTYQGGTTQNTYGYGIVYKVTPAGVYHVLHKFTGYPTDGAYPYAGLLPLNGKLYGATAGGGASNSGTVYEITPSGSEHVVYSFKGSPDGTGPSAAPIAVNGTLYGTTKSGGQYNAGTVYKVTTSGNEQVLHSFDYVVTDGANPTAGLVNVNGELYGTTYYGGKNDDGIVFKIAP